MARNTESEVVQEVVNVEFPKTVGDLVFNTPEELASYVKDLQEKTSAAKAVLKTLPKAPRPTSQRKAIADLVSAVLNEHANTDLMERVTSLEETTAIRIVFNIESGQFEAPVTKTRESGTGTGTRTGSPLTVDGVEYPSAKNARETLYPDTIGKQQNKKSIISFLSGKGHTVIE